MPIHILGDSNGLAFRFQTLSSPQYFARPIVTVVQYFAGFSAYDTFRDDKFHPELDAYVRDPIFSRGVLGRTTRRGIGPNPVRLQISKNDPALADEFNYLNNPVVVLCSGALDVAWLLSELGPGVDFHLDDPRFVAEAFETVFHARVSYDAVRELCRNRLAPIELALRRLAGMNFSRLYVRNVHPPSLDDIQYFRIRRVLTSAAQRYKVTILVNRILQQSTEAAGARFLDTWDETTHGGRVRPEFVYDADHLNRAAAEIALRKLLGDLIVRRSAPVEEIDRFAIG